MKKFNDIVNEGYWGCKPLENDYVLDKQSNFYQSILKKAFNDVKIGKSYEELYFSVAIALDLLERLKGSEGFYGFIHRNQIQEHLNKCLDKIYDGFKGEWTKTSDEEWTTTINGLRKKVTTLFTINNK